jgi:hypothetical protein
MVRHDEELNFRSARCRDNLSHMIEKVLFLGDLFEQGPKLAAFAKEIVVGVEEQEAGSVGRIIGHSHVIFLPNEAPRSSSAPNRFVSVSNGGCKVFISSKVEHKKFSCFGSSNLQDLFFVDGRAIARVQPRAIKRHRTARHMREGVATRLQAKSSLRSGRKAGRPDVNILMHCDGSIPSRFRGNESPFVSVLIKRESPLLICGR